MVTQVSNGMTYGRTLVSTNKIYGGAKHVFVPLPGIKNELVFAPFGGILKNPPKGGGKLFAGDLFYLKYDDNAENPELYALKTYLVHSASGSVVNVVRDGFKHIPFVGDVLTIAPAKIGGQGEALTVVAVTRTQESGVDVWALTMSAAPTTAPKKDDVLVDCDTNGNMLVKDINGVAPYDYEFAFAPVANSNIDDDFESARYLIAPVLGGRMITKRMSPMPKCVLALNTAKINGWFEVGGANGFL